MIDWLVAQTRPQAEAKAEDHLKRQGFAVYLPRYLRIRRHARRREVVARPLFPRYLFVGIDPVRSLWRSIRSTVGVSHLVAFGDKPVVVPPRILDEIRAREDENGMVVMNPALHLAKGDPVRVVDGALCDRVGLFDHIDDNRRVVILLELLGRPVRVRLPIEAVHAYA